MKSNKIICFIMLLLVISSCSKKSNHTDHDQFTCPMHSTVIQDRPGSCPVCGMDLVKKGKAGDEVKITSELNYLLKPTNATVIASIKTISPVRKSMDIETEVNGVITYDTRRFTSISARFSGRIEKLFVKYNFQPVRKGQKIIEIYSPELLTAQRDLLYLIKTDKENSLLVDGAKEKLRLLGVSNTQIDHLISQGQESYSFAVYSPVDGYIIEESSIKPSTTASAKKSNASSMDGGMTGNSANAQQTSISSEGSELLTREGMYVSAGQTVFKVVNIEYVWAEFDMYQRDAALIKVNDQIQISDNASQPLEGKVNFVQPFFKTGESFAKVRAYLSNANGRFHIGQLITGKFVQKSSEVMWIPLSAKLELGTKEISFTKNRGVFQPKVIVTSRQSGDWVEIVKGLEIIDTLAINAQFMVDSEGFIKVRN